MHYHVPVHFGLVTLVTMFFIASSCFKAKNNKPGLRSCPQL